MERDIILQVDYPAPPDAVWSELTEPELLREWLMEKTFRAGKRARCEFRMPPAPGFSGLIQCEVMEVELHRRLVYTWDGGGAWGKTTVARTLEPSGSGTRLRLEPRKAMLSFRDEDTWIAHVWSTNRKLAQTRL